MGQPANFKMTSTFGHLMKTEFSTKFNQNQCDPLELYSCSIEKMEANPKQKTLKVLFFLFLQFDYYLDAFK